MEKEQNRYFYADYGKESNQEVLLIAGITVDAIKMMDNFHIVVYQTDEKDSFFVKEITEDEFLEHHKPQLKEN